MANRGWQVGPVLKDKAGSQGTLFRGGSSQMSDARFPKGYTPERQAEVRGAVEMTPAWSSDTEGQKQGRLATHRQLVDTISRSTVPVEHLSNLQFAHVEKHQDVTADGQAAGAYFGRSGTPMIGIKPQYLDTKTTIHEVGHHVSSTQGTEHSQKYSYETEHGGHEEAFADNYAQEHFRDRKGQQQAVSQYGGGKYSAFGASRSDAFWDGYGKNRQHLPFDDSGDDDYYKHRPEEKIHPDGSQDVEMIHAYPGYDYDTGKATSELGGINSDAIHW